MSSQIRQTARVASSVASDPAPFIPTRYLTQKTLRRARRVAPRSGLAWKKSIDTGAGVIDEDYRGIVRVILFNHSDTDFEIKRGDRIAQLILERILTPEVVETEELSETVRGAGGFGSTGV